MRASLARRVAAVQTAYYAVTGVWPLVHKPSFEIVTGPKRDGEWWLVETVGLLVTALGAGLGLAAATDRVTPELAVAAAGAAASLAAVDVVYVWKGRIAPTYLGDAAVEA